MISLLLASIAFVGTHFVMSHPLRAWLTSIAGEKGFTGVYSIVSLLTFCWMIAAYLATPIGIPVWSAGNITWIVVTIVMLLASVLLAGSFVRNPAFPTMGAPLSTPGTAQGVYAITRHPMMWAFALWGFAHIAIFPTGKNVVLSAAIIVLALVGSASQDAKKRRLQPAFWPAWQEQTSFVPFVAVMQGRARIGKLGWVAGIGGLVIWLVGSYAHVPIAGIAAGVWRYV